MKMDEREASLNKIKTSMKCNVILVSFKAGSTGQYVLPWDNVLLSE
jgi:hypothetical protein